MGQPDHRAYDASVIDWPKLHAWARKVAKSTPVPPAEELYGTMAESVTQRAKVGSGFLGLLRRSEDIVEKQSARKRALGPHWVLDTEEMEWITGKILPAGPGHQGANRTDDRRIAFYYVLESDGKLTTVCDYTYVASTRSGKSLVESELRVKQFDEYDVRTFDHAKVREIREAWNTHRTGEEEWIDAHEDMRSGRLLRHVKGVGLSMRLKELSEGPLKPISGRRYSVKPQRGDFGYPGSSALMSRR